MGGILLGRIEYIGVRPHEVENILLFFKYLNVNFKRENGGSESAIVFILSEHQSISDGIVIEDKIDVKMPACKLP